MFSKKSSIFAAIGASVLVVACNSDDDKETIYEASDVKAHYVKLAHAMYSDSLTTAKTLQTAVDAFIASPSEVNLTAARAAYKATRVPYQQSEIMRFDSSITVGKDLDSDGGPASVDDWEGQVNAWPLDENHIVSLIAGSDAINTDLLLNQNGANDSEANVTTGVHAIEFMLWGEDTHGTNAGAGERSAVEFDVNNCPDTDCERRAQYLKVATDLLVDDLTAMQAEWTQTAAATSGTLAYNFLDSDAALDYIVGSIFAMATDELASARMNSGLTLRDPEEEHDCFSDLSHLAIYYNFQGVKNAFYGTYGDLSGASLSHLIKQKDQTTYDRIDAALTSVEDKMYQIYQAGERTENTVKFDQIIGQDSAGVERQIAVAAVSELIALDSLLHEAVELLSLSPIDTSGSGDGD